ncbi:protein PAXX isoform X2 [Tyto alba]|uniref:protein PAXX isoform X2 n=1 Tax=Tyto alba TaxID=56313 RepID=UPI001C67A3C0|nr:protein PAXX isoform X2 [Tyto alba]
MAPPPGPARPFRRCRHGGAGRALPPAAGRDGQVPLLLPPRPRPRRHSLCDRRAGSLGRGSGRPLAARLRTYRGRGGGGAGGRGPGQAGFLGRSPSPPQPCQPEEHGEKLREAVGRGAAALSLGEGTATLQPRSEEARCSALDLIKLPVAEARSQLQGLVFGMAGRIESLEKRLEVVETPAPSCSPEKNDAWSQQRFLPDPSPRKKRGAGSALPAKRKIPGESLINPGFKSKKAPSGVDFEDS